MRFELAYSPVTFLALLGLHLLAAVSVFLTTLPALVQLLAVIGLVSSATTVWRDYGCCSSQRIRCCSITSQGSILSDEFGREYFGLPRLVYRSEYLVLLDFVRQGSGARWPGSGRRKLILSADALSEADFCRLQRYLRFEL